MSSGYQTGNERVFNLTPWSKRVGGALVDVLVASAAGLAFLFLGRLVSEGVGTFLAFVAMTGVGVWQWVQQGNTGQTLGKRAIGIKLVAESDAHPVGAVRSVGRGFVHVVDMALCYLGFFFPLWDERRQTLADKILATVVVDASTD